MSQPSPIIVAHRGFHKDAPENSLGAFIAAVEAGIPWVECDVWPSSDGVPMVIHDATLDRTTAGKGIVRHFSCEELRDLQVPSLTDVLSVLAKTTGILVEIKPSDADDFVRSVVDLLYEYWGPWMIQSFDESNVGHALLQTRYIPTALLIDNPAKLQESLDAGWPIIHAAHSLIDREVVHRLHNNGRKIGAWTVNETADIRRMIDIGVDMLITDEPELAMKMIATR